MKFENQFTLSLPPPPQCQVAMWEKMLMYKGNTKHFFEAGTYMGLTANWAVNYWDTVTTCEAHKATYKKYSPHLVESIDHANCKSIEMLQNYENKMPAYIWLDAHYSGPEQSSDSQARSSDSFFWDGHHPLIEELEYILNNAGKFSQSTIVIDDWDQIESGHNFMPNVSKVLDLINITPKIVTYFIDDSGRNFKFAVFQIGKRD